MVMKTALFIFILTISLPVFADFNESEKESCARVSLIDYYYRHLIKLNNISGIDKEINILIEKERKHVKSFLFKYDCNK